MDKKIEEEIIEDFRRGHNGEESMEVAEAEAEIKIAIEKLKEKSCPQE